MKFQYLAQTLHTNADTVAKHFRVQHGVRQIQPEAEFEPDISYRPTLTGRTQDHYRLCVEVTDVGFSGSLESFVLTCGARGLPVKCYIAVPKGVSDSTFREMRRRSQEFGVGLLEIGDNSCELVHGAMPLTLFGYRRPDRARFPAKYRQALSDAESVLRGGDPAKACSLVYDEIERLSREIAKKVNSKSLWRALHAGEKRPSPNLDSGAWQMVMTLLHGHLDYKAIKGQGKDLTASLLGKVMGIVPHRNETGHKPATREALIARDRELRTRFEHAVDTLLDLITASRFLGV